MDIPFELYKIFYHAAHCKSFSLAATQLFITPSAVSQAIANLEAKTGSLLFYRKARTVSLTSEGQMLLKHVEQAYNFLKSGENKLVQMQNMELGEVRIGIGDTILKYFLIPYLHQFIQQYPRIKFHVVNRTSRQIVAALENGLADIGIITLPYENPNIRIREFIRVEDIFVASEPFAFLKDRTIELHTLADYPVLMLEKDSSTRKHIDEFLSLHGVSIQPEIELESIDLLVEFAKIGMGIAHVLKESALAMIQAGELFQLRIQLPLPQRQLGIITMKNMPLSKASIGFIEMLESFMQP